MEQQERLFVRAGKLFEAARITAEAALRKAGPVGMPGRELFVLCQQECKRQVPSLDYDEDLFRTTLQDLRLDNWTTFRIEDGGRCILSR